MWWKIRASIVSSLPHRLSLSLCDRLFENCPPARVLFGFPIDIDVNSEELIKSKRFLAHAAYLLEMIDTALNMLGPDDELLTEIMYDLGNKHSRYGVKAAMFPVMGEALEYMLHKTIGEKFTDSRRESWRITYSALSTDMILAQGNSTSSR
jgi:hypothetical protein